MGFLQIPPPQGFNSGQELSIITGPASPRYGPPQGSGVTPPSGMGLALVQTGSLTALVQTGTLTALIQTGTG